VDKKSFWIGGRHAVEAALNNKNREIVRVVSLQEIKVASKRIEIQIENKKFFNKIFMDKDLAHQGIAALIKPLKKHSLEEEIKNNNLKNLIALDGITDTRNVGSIIRNAVAFNIDGIIVNKKEINQDSQAMYKAASGAMENIKIFPVSNITNYIKLLKKNDFWVIGFDSNAKRNFEKFKWFKKNLLIFGSENKGIGKNLLSNCDEVLKINISNKIDSLNVSCATSAVLCNLNSNCFSD
jgi:23S rRNA (guanosine2251-2'-O)-methyltransferase